MLCVSLYIYIYIYICVFVVWNAIRYRSPWTTVAAAVSAAAPAVYIIRQR